MPKQYYTFLPNEIDSEDRKASCSKAQRSKNSLYTFTDISKNESTSRNVVDNELVDMLSEVVEDFKSESSRSETWSVEAVEIEPLGGDIVPPN